MKKLITLFLLLVAVLLPFTATAYDFMESGICYNVNQDGKSVTVTYEKNTWPFYSNASGSLIIPTSVTHNGATYAVTTIGEFAFMGCRGFTGSLTIPASVTTIGDYAFASCEGFTGSLTIPNSVTTIGKHAFLYCFGFTGSLTIGDSVTDIGYGAFEDCSGFTGSLTIPNSVTAIGEGAFMGCSGITDITIPSNLVNIGGDAFYGTVWFNNQPDGVVYIGNVAYKYKGTLPSGTTLILRDGIKGIAGRAFQGCSGFMGSLTIPESVTSIGKLAFLGCSGFTGSLTIPKSVTSIGGSAFGNCLGIETLTVVPDNPKYDSRDNCNAIIETATNTMIGGIKNFTIPESVTSIGEGAFMGCSGFTGSLTIPNSVTAIGNSAFESCSGFSGSLTIGNSVSSIGDYAFYICEGFTGALSIPNSVTSIGDYAFDGCSGFTGSLIIPNSVTSIGKEAFNGSFYSMILTGSGSFDVTCSSLPSVPAIYVKSGITGIKGLQLDPFSEIVSEIYSYANIPPECNENTFCRYTATLHVPQRSLATYFDAPYWSNFGTIEGDAVEPKGLTWEQEDISLKIGDQLTLDTPILLPANAGLRIDVHSSNPDVVTLSSYYDENDEYTYIIQGVKVGEADVVVTCAWFEARCHITVTGTETMTTITLDKHEIEMGAGTMVTLIPTSSPVAVEGYVVESSDRSVATARVINGRVQVVGAKPGKATITVGDVDGKAQPDSCVVTVTRPRGDASNDGYTDVEDLNAIINVLLDLAPAPNDDNMPFYDLTDDGKVDVEDVNAIINVILGLPEPSKKHTFTVNGVKFKMVEVKGGTFTMGATAEQGSVYDSDECPTHQVTLSNFSFGETEVTQELWLAVMGSNPSWFNGYGNSDYGTDHSDFDYGTNLQRPVECVCWDACQTFITKLNQLTGKTFRLPTEAEWEYAARGGNKSQGYKYAGSNTIGDVAWYWDNIPSRTPGTAGYGTQTVGTKAPNELGLYDMSGNVWEWCQDWCGTYSSGAQTNPTGPSSGSFRVRRGGSLHCDSWSCRVSDRDCWEADNWDCDFGLRLVLDTDNEWALPGPDNAVTYTVNGVKFKMVDVEGGTFSMGATAEQGGDAYSDENPAHQVTLSDYSIGTTEVTQELWQAVMGSNPSYFNGTGNTDMGSSHSANYGTNLKRPVEYVSWDDCQSFIHKLNQLTGENFRLPTEAEWEYAARGGNKFKGFKYSGSNTIDIVAWYSTNAYNVGGSSSDYGTHTVGTKAPNELGLYDMSGNVLEWCQDWYGGYNSDAQINPAGPTNGTYHVGRGGCWFASARSCRTSNRSKSADKGYQYGLRLAK